MRLMETTETTTETTPINLETTDYDDWLGFADSDPVPTGVEFPDLETDTFQINGENFTGTLLGYSSSREWAHSNHVGTYAPKGVPCQACRWSDMSLWLNDQSRFVWLRRGRALDPELNERMRHKLGVCESAIVLVEQLAKPVRDRNGIVTEHIYDALTMATIEEATTPVPGLMDAVSAYAAQNDIRMARPRYAKIRPTEQ